MHMMVSNCTYLISISYARTMVGSIRAASWPVQYLFLDCCLVAVVAAPKRAAVKPADIAVVYRFDCLCRMPSDSCCGACITWVLVVVINRAASYTVLLLRGGTGDKRARKVGFKLEELSAARAGNATRTRCAMRIPIRDKEQRHY